MELIALKDEIEQLAYTLKRLLDTDIIVVDKHMNRVINTFEYQQAPIGIKVNSVVGNIIVTAREKVVKDRRCSEECKKCPQFEQCEIGSIAGVPIMEGKSCAGVIAILVRPRLDGKMKWTLEDAVDFLRQMAEMISGKIQRNYFQELAANIDKSANGLLDKVQEPIVVFDESRRICFANRKFQEFFLEEGEEPRGYPLDECLERRSMYKRQRDQGYTVGSRFFKETSGILRLASEQKNELEEETEKTAYFFEYVDVAFMKKKQARMFKIPEWIDLYFSDSDVMRPAKEAVKRAAYNELSMLIEGRHKEENDEIAKMFLLKYAADGGGILEVECGKIERVLEQELFGVPGKFQGSVVMAGGRALGLYSIEKLPLYLQKKLVEYLALLQAKEGYGENIRLITTSEAGLEEYVKRGLFLEELYYYVSQNYIRMPDIAENREDLKFYFSRYMDYYSRVYHSTSWKGDDVILDYLAECEWPESRQSIRTFSEIIIKNTVKSRITLEEVKRLQFKYGFKKAEKGGKCDPDKIRELLLYSEKSKKDIAKELGIGRATLYRWMSKYNI